MSHDMSTCFHTSYWPIYLAAYLLGNLSIHRSVYLTAVPVCLFVSLFVCLFVFRSKASKWAFWMSNCEDPVSNSQLLAFVFDWTGSHAFAKCPLCFVRDLDSIGSITPFPIFARMLRKIVIWSVDQLHVQDRGGTKQSKQMSYRCKLRDSWTFSGAMWIPIASVLENQSTQNHVIWLELFSLEANTFFPSLSDANLSNGIVEWS